MLALLYCYHTVSIIKNISCYVDKTSNILIFKEDQILNDADAYAVYDDGISTTGWYKLHVVGNEKSDSHDMMRCAGGVEGYISQKDIYNHFMLICDIKHFPRNAKTDEERYSSQWLNFLKSNMRYLTQSIESYPEVTYWQSASLIFDQFMGLAEGYKQAAGNNDRMSVLDHWVLQSQGDLGDTSRALDRMPKGPSGPTSNSLLDLPDGDPETLGDHCTGLIKITEDYSDIYVAHDAWSDYRDLHGALKEYTLPIKEFKAKTISMSTRIGKLSSYDDFYLTDSGLMVIETTMSIFNLDLYEFVQPKSIYTWFRALLAMWTTDNGKDWTETFIKHNSGTYNNQYLIVDMKKFKRFEKPSKDLIWVIEQYPGKYWKNADITEKFIQDKYFPSINKPHFEELFKIAGYPDKIKTAGQIGNFYSYETSARYLIIQREAPRLNNFEDFKLFMQYNNWKRDPYSNGDSSQQIMSRYDLRRSGDPYGTRKAFGGLDSKAMRLTEVITGMNFHAIASPSHMNGNSIWKFGTSEFSDINFDGLPKEWNFTWLEFKPLNYNYCSNLLNQNSCLEKEFCGWCIYSQKCLPGDKKSPYFNEKCEAGWNIKETFPKWAPTLVLFTCIIVVGFVLIIYTLHFTTKKEYL